MFKWISEEARKLRRLSILAGFDRKFAKVRRQQRFIKLVPPQTFYDFSLKSLLLVGPL